MIAWMFATLLASTMIAGAALAADEASRLLLRPRRWAWAAAMASATALPFILRYLPAEPNVAAPDTAIDPALLAELLARAPAAAAPAGFFERALADPSTGPIALGLWLTSAALMLGALGFTYLRLRRVRATADPVEIAGIPALLTRVIGPMVVGVRRPQVVVPRWIATLSEEELRLVVRHEWEHVRARDTRLLLFSAVVVAAMPWNLPLWWMRRRLRQAVEVDCDARVLAAGADRRIYGSMLIQTAGRPAPTPLLAPALVELPSLLERRIVAMTSKLPAHRGLRFAAVATVASLLLIAACELTPRGGSLSPTEPTLSDVIDPADTEGELVIEVETFEDAEPDVTTIGKVMDGDVSVIHYTVADTAEGPTRMLVRLRPGTVPGGVEATSIGGEPLILVDGVPVASIDKIDRSRIAEINVIKGPAAAAEFGARAKDGVVKITTGEPTTTPRVGVRQPSAAGSVIDSVVAVGYGVRIGEVGPVFEKVRAVGYGERTREVEPVIEKVRAVGYGAVESGTVTSSERPVGFRIRGAGTGGPQPLMLVEGKQIESLASIDPSTVESIQVLKDASATALYGSRGANGVILITLKK
jgi:TonB-dependent SusC/RagA subfamily outer membrane receptor